MAKHLMLSVVLAWLVAATAALAGPLAGPYTDPDQLRKLPFGARSHWLQPWRAYLETVPSGRFLQGVGLNYNVNLADPEPLVALLARHGVRHLRIEVSWSTIDPANEAKLSNSGRLSALLAAARTHGLRPLLLLNANSGLPCPFVTHTLTLAEPAVAGATEIVLTDPRGLVAGRSGLSNLGRFAWAAENLIVALDGNRAKLSKPLTRAYPAGARLVGHTLNYRPFGPPDSAEYRATIAGWLRYVETVARLAGDQLGTPTDRGFDLEIWNELTFGSEFLNINNYYARPLYTFKPDLVWVAIVRDTAALVQARPDLFRGVGVSDGFANTIPWPHAAGEPPGITALSKHPYAGRGTLPAVAARLRGTALGADGQPTRFEPTYSWYLPEYFATGIQTETLARDLAPFDNGIYKAVHGRFAGRVDGKVVERPVWITEVNLSPAEDDTQVSVERAWALKAKTTARYLCFYLNKGAARVSLFAVRGGDRYAGMVRQDLLDRLGRGERISDREEASPALAVVGRIARVMAEGSDPSLTVTRPLTVLSVRDDHDRIQFAGEDKPGGAPPLYDRDVLAILPFQANARRFVVPYYVVTRDVARDLPPEPFTVELQGIATAASVRAYDPIADRSVPVRVLKRQGDHRLTLVVEATDYPRLLVFEEPPSKR